MNINPDHMPLESWIDFRHIADNRDEIAVLLWRIVAEFIGDCQPLAGHEPLWAAAERYIRDNAEAAEQRTIVYRDRRALPAAPCALPRQRQDVIMEVLTDLALVDDYSRIKRGEQHLAFADV